MSVIRTALVSALLALSCLPALATPSSAAPPQRAGDYVTDQDGVLDAAGQARVRAALDTLYAKHQVRLWVVFVADFGGLNRAQWADKTVQINDFGDRDVLLAVATKDRDYVLSTPKLSGLSSGEQKRLRPIRNRRCAIMTGPEPPPAPPMVLAPH